MLFLAVILGFASKTYVFGVSTAFVMLQDLPIYKELLTGVIFTKIYTNIQPIVLFGVLYLLFKILFSDIVGVLILSAWEWLMSLKKRGTERSSGDEHEGHGVHEDHGHGGREDHGYGEDDFHEDHDDHGHGGKH